MVLCISARCFASFIRVLDKEDDQTLANFELVDQTAGGKFIEEDVARTSPFEFGRTMREKSVLLTATKPVPKDGELILPFMPWSIKPVRNLLSST